jgi:hypothetical protein
MLPPLPVVHGRVTSAGRPVSGARVTAEELGSATNRQPAKFSQDGDTDGEFRLTFKQEGRFAVRATIPGGAASTPVPLDMAWGVDVPLDFELGTASIRGRVIDSDGTLAAAELKVRLQRDGQAATDWLEASAAGDFWFHPLLPGQYVVEVQGKAYPPTLGEHLEVGGAQQLEGVVVTVAKGAAIDGLILDAQGQPDASWVYLVRPVVPPVPEQLGAPKGVFRIEGLPPGRYKLIVAGATYADWWQDPHFEDLARASVKAEVEVELAAGEVRRVTLQSRE